MTIAFRASTNALFAFEISTAQGAIGWARAGRVGLYGFDTHQEARSAGRVAARVLADWYASRWRGAPIPWPDAAPMVPIVSDDVVVGRILQEHDVELRHRASHGIEVGLPPETWTALLIEVAQRLHTAILDAGIGIQPSRLDRAS
jgi:hypothetical protein